MAATTLSAIMPADIEQAAERLLQRLCARDERIATAESCTGGLLASLLTDVPGCSHAFERGFVVYTDAAKQELLRVPAALLHSVGAVSEPVARAMAQGGLEASGATYCVAVTGYADDAGGEAEAGLVHFAIAGPGDRVEHRCERFKDIGRGAVRTACLRTALNLLEQAVG